MTRILKAPVVIAGAVSTFSGHAYADVFGKWKTGELSAELSDPTTMGILNSDNKIETFTKGSVRVDLTVVCSPPEKAGFAMMIDWEDDVPDLPKYSVSIKYRLDDGQIESGAVDMRRHAILFNYQPAAWVMKFMKAKRLVVSLPNSKGGQEAIFNIDQMNYMLASITRRGKASCITGQKDAAE